MLTVKDNGCGYDPAATKLRAVGGGSMGLLGMQERALLIDGTLDIESAPGAGCTVRLRCPMRLRELSA